MLPPLRGFRGPILLPMVVLLLGVGVAPARGAGPAAKWVGQDGRDFVGGEPGPKPNGYQDIHVAVVGIPPGRSVPEFTLQGHGHGAWGSSKTDKSAIHVVRGNRPGAFDLYFEPYQAETGREFELKWKLDTGATGGLYFPGGRADPNKRAAGLGIEAKWVHHPVAAQSPDLRDVTNPGVSVGPDGVDDACIEVGRLDPKAEVRTVELTLPGPGPAPRAWCSGTNPAGLAGAEFHRPAGATSGLLWFSPPADLVTGKILNLTVTYEGGRTDTATVAVTPTRLPKPVPPARLPASAPPPLDSRLNVVWLGQVDDAVRGEVQIEVQGWSVDRGLKWAVLSDGALSTWLGRNSASINFAVGPDPLPLRLIPPGGRRWERFGFVPTRDESGATMTLRLRDAAGRTEIVRFPGRAIDLARLAPPLSADSVTAQPGDDLAALVARGGTITLAPGTYRLARPLTCDRPVRIIGPGATLRFDQPRDSGPWAAAIRLHSGNSTLEGFAVRFAGPIRWDHKVDHGPSVVATSDPHEGRREPHRHAVALVNLDLEAPPASSDWEEATSLVKFLSASSGRIERCRLRGGMIQLGNGPWTVADNEYRGCPPQTYNQGVISALYGHDLTIARNHAHDVGPSGKTWRFVILTQRGVNDVVADNVVDGGIGARVDDPHPHQNAPEIILTEAYRLRFEGKPRAISPDGLTLVIPHPQGGEPSAGDSVALLAGPEAGTWRTIAQVLDAGTYLLDAPIPRETTAVSVATGFVRESFLRNTVDVRGSGIAAPLVLAGNLFGVRVEGNRLYGGNETVRLHASPTESPVHWGWSHAPFLGGTFADNLVEDAVGLGSFGLGVEHGPPIRTNRGRVYMSLLFRDNTFRWTPAGLAARATLDPAAASRPPRFVFGNVPSLDPAELRITERGTRLEGAPPATLWVNGAVINGKLVRDQPLEPRP